MPGQQVAIPGRLGHIASQRAVRAVLIDELLELGEQGHGVVHFPFTPRGSTVSGRQVNSTT